MVKYKVLAVVTKYWRPGEKYLDEIVKGVEGKIADYDFVVMSEKAISTASNNIVDENIIKPSLNARLITRFWMHIVWTYFLGSLCHFQERPVRWYRNIPLEMTSRHKQVALEHAGLLQALMFGSESGIDGSNLAYSYVSLPLNNANEVAKKIREQIWQKSGKKVFVMIVDTDKTYSFRNFHFTPLPRPIEGIHSLHGVVGYVIGRMFKLKKRATPIALVGCNMPAEKALEIAEIANRSRGCGAGGNVLDVAKRFNVKLDSVNWEMLETVKHKPIVIIRTRR